ncbi:MAG TPA: M23 family metallopeptidase [Gaiellaceae bacterium]
MAPEVAVSALPARVFREELDGATALQFDLQLENNTDRSLRLTGIDYLGFDGQEALVLRRTVDEHGLRPGIEVIPERDVPALRTLLLFNPLCRFPRSLDLRRLHVRCHLEVADADAPDSFVAETDVRPVAYSPRVTLVLPLVGRVFVANGHDFLSPHRRIDPTHPIAIQFGVRTNSGRYADDFSLVDDAGSLYSRDGLELRDWIGFGAPVRAPGAGTIVAAVSSVPDNTFTSTGVEFAEPHEHEPAAAIFGNHLVIDHGSDEFSVLGHLEHDSVTVEPGERVDAEQRVGSLGLSGNTDFVHLHYQLQGRPDARLAEGLPARFANIDHPLEPGTIVDSR